MNKKRQRKIKTKMQRIVKALVITLLIVAILALMFNFLPDEILEKLGLIDPAKDPIIDTGINKDELKVHFIDVGQGDSIFIQLPDGKNMLIDGGDKSADAFDAIDDLLQSLEVTQIDYLMLTHSDADHCGGLDNVIEEYDVIDFFVPDIDTKQHDTIAYSDFLELMEKEVEENKGEKTISILGEEIVGKDYRFDFYLPTLDMYKDLPDDDLSGHQKNMVSPVMILTYEGRKVMFTGDTNLENEDVFIELYTGRKDLDIDVLKVAHHGSREATTNEFLDISTPEYAIISCGEDNSYGHPHVELVDRLEEYNVESYRTDERGNITLTLDGEGSGDADIIFEFELKVA